jgi:hypothetical protein
MERRNGKRTHEVPLERRPAMDEEVSEAEASAMRSVATFLDRERANRRSARRTWYSLLGLVVGVGALHAMTLAGWLPPEGRDVIASASAVGAVGLGVLAQR